MAKTTKEIRSLSSVQRLVLSVLDRHKWIRAPNDNPKLAMTLRWLARRSTPLAQCQVNDNGVESYRITPEGKAALMNGVIP